MPPHSARTELLDCKRIRQLRHAHGYSVRRIARQLGVSATTITNLETGVNHAEVALRLVTDLAHQLGVTPAELFARPAAQPAAPTSDDQAIEAALASQLSNNNDRPRRRPRLEPRTGPKRAPIAGATSSELRHPRYDHGWQRHALRPATEHLSDEQQQALHRGGPQRRGMTIQTASLLADVAAGALGKTWHRNPSANQRIVLQTLLNQGLVEAHTDE